MPCPFSLILLRVNSALSGGMTIHHSNKGYETNTINREMDMSRSFFPKVDLTRDDDDANSHMSDIPLLLLASANDSSNKSALVTLSQAGGDLMQHVHSLNPIPNQTGRILGNCSIPLTYPQSVPADP